MADSKKYDGSQWEHSLRKLTTATEAVENPLYSDGTAISTYTIKGNTVQSGTPTPSNPVEVQGVGNKTANLLFVDQSNAVNYSTSSVYAYTINSDRTISIPSGKAMYTGFKVKVSPNTTYTLHSLASTNGQMRIREYSEIITDWNTNFITQSVNQTIGISNTTSFTTTAETEWVLANWYIDGNYTPCTLSELELLEGEYTVQTLPTYEPYGFKIPISSGGVTTPIYLTEQLMKIGDTVDSLASTGTATYNTYKLVLTGNESWYDDALPKGNTYSYRMIAPYIYDVGNTVGYDAICTHFDVGAYYDANIVGVQHSSRNLYFRNTQTTLANWQQWLADQYAAGTPVTIYYRVATPTTETVTAPSIPTTEGANSITVDTTVQPSEFTATWTGWHDASVKEKSENLWNEDYTDISGTMKYNAIYVGDGEFTLSSNIVNNNYSYIFFLAGRPQSGASTGTNDVYNGQSRTVTAINGYVTIAFRSTASYSPESYNTMLNSGSTAQTYEPYWK